MFGASRAKNDEVAADVVVNGVEARVEKGGQKVGGMSVLGMEEKSRQGGNGEDFLILEEEERDQCEGGFGMFFFFFVWISKLCCVAGQCSLHEYIQVSPIMHTCRPIPHLPLHPWEAAEALSP